MQKCHQKEGNGEKPKISVGSQEIPRLWSYIWCQILAVPMTYFGNPAKLDVTGWETRISKKN
jgi:hypothetical protein